MVTHLSKDGHTPKGCILQTRNLALRLNSQNRWKMMEFDTEEQIFADLFFVIEIFNIGLASLKNAVFKNGG